MDEPQAIQLLKKGEIAGLEFLVCRYQVKAVRTAYLITRDLGLAEDLVQDAFIHAFRAIRGFDETHSFEPWFMRSVVNASVKLVQKSARQVQFGEDTDGSVLAALVAQVESVESQVESIQFQHQIWESMQKLSPRQKAVIVQRYFLGMSEAEMAEKSGTANGTIKWLLNAARQRLSRLWERRER